MGSSLGRLERRGEHLGPHEDAIDREPNRAGQPVDDVQGDAALLAAEPFGDGRRAQVEAGGDGALAGVLAGGAQFVLGRIGENRKGIQD
jgi:hypothetical protein